MRLLHIISSVDPRSGGPIEGILRQNACTKEYVQREIVCTDDPSSPWLGNFPVRVYALGTDRRGTPPIAKKLLQHYRYSSQLEPWLHQNVSSYDGVIVNGLWNYSTWAARRVLENGPVPYVVFTHGQLDPWFAKTYPWKDQLKKLFWLINEGRLLSKARAVAFTCEEEFQLAKGRYAGHQNFKPEVVGYGTTEPPMVTPNQSIAFRNLVPNLTPGKRFLLFLSRIHRKKGCDLLLEAFGMVAQKVTDLDLVVAGPDQEGWTEQLKSRAAELDISSRVHWPGHLQGDAKWGAFRSADAFILPSHSENFGIVVAEALACRTPVLITSKVNIWREIDANEAGITEDDTLDGTHRMISRWLSLPDYTKEQMRRNARSCFEKNFRMEDASNRVVSIFSNNRELS